MPANLDVVKKWHKELTSWYDDNGELRHEIDDNAAELIRHQQAYE